MLTPPFHNLLTIGQTSPLPDTEDDLSMDESVDYDDDIANLEQENAHLEDELHVLYQQVLAPVSNLSPFFAML